MRGDGSGEPIQHPNEGQPHVAFFSAKLAQATRALTTLQIQNEIHDPFDVVCGQLRDVQLYMHARFDDADKRFDAIDRRFEAVDRRFDAVDRRFDRLEAKVDALPRIIAELIAKR